MWKFSNVRGEVAETTGKCVNKNVLWHKLILVPGEIMQIMGINKIAKDKVVPGRQWRAVKICKVLPYLRKVLPKYQ